MYEERMLQVADSLCEMEVGPGSQGSSNRWRRLLHQPLHPQLYEVALWQGYGLHLLRFSPRRITDIADVDHFMACFFPEGLEAERDAFTLKVACVCRACVRCAVLPSWMRVHVQVRAMQGCALCILEQEKRQRSLSPRGLCKLLRVLRFLRILMQVFQQHEHLCWHAYNGTPPHPHPHPPGPAAFCSVQPTSDCVLVSHKLLYTSTRSAAT